MKAMAVDIEVLSMKVSLVLLDGVFKDPSGKVGHDLREDNKLSQTLTSNRKMSKNYLNSL